jgi:ornithine cyclodeaminase
LAQLAAVAAVRKLKRVNLWSRNPSKQETFAASVRKLGFDFEIALPRQVGEACDGADIVTLATRAREPFFEAAMAMTGAHINAIGAITPEREEFSQDLFARAGLIAVDDPATARRLSRELSLYLDAAGERALPITPLSDVVAGGRKRAPGEDISIFKAMGMGVSDLALANEIYERALVQGLGRAFEHPARVAPRLR